MSKLGTYVLTASLALAGTGAALAAEEAKPAAPSLSDVLAASGITASGYVDGTYSYASVSPPGGGSVDSNTFALNQASLSLAYTPSSGFGALVNAIAGTEACDGCYAPGYPGGAPASTSNVNLLQAYGQYVAGKTTVYVGKFTTVAGAEVAAPTGNTNVTRSLLFWYMEPVTHVGARLSYAATDKVTLLVGVNNGWNVDTSPGSAKTYEFSATLAPSKAFTLAASAYYTATDSTAGAKTLIDLVATWVATPKLTVVATSDWDKQEFVGGGSASWWGIAGYLNYAINDAWRVSLRGEYMDDQDGFVLGGTKNKVNEGTLTFGYAPSKHFEARIEGRYDTYKPEATSSTDATQFWLQALYKF